MYTEETEATVLTVEIKVEEEENTFAGTYSAVYTHPMNGMMYDMILVFNADGTGKYMLMNNGYEGTFNYTYEGMLTMTDFVSTFGGEISIIGIVSEDTIYSTITLVADDAKINVDFVKE